MLKILFPLGLRPSSTPQNPTAPSCTLQRLAVFKGPTSKGKREEEKGEKRRGKGEKGPGPQIFWPRTSPLSRYFDHFFYEVNSTKRKQLRFNTVTKSERKVSNCLYYYDVI